MTELGPVTRYMKAEAEVELLQGSLRRAMRRIRDLNAGLVRVDNLRRGIIGDIATLPPGRSVQADAMFDIAVRLREIVGP